ncbi:hypothetical protein [Paracoccus lutimaris]|uniref:Uncharacterized protein n=1 Tax=Paracoccus lutimaris TaxID=1490030 RepID=A0A368ZBU8_9RHOB|nr:hypothetical protein [Paracoccus lutimaris]RCW88976.1 hypothetical protein DFP89_101415 [Paracoccus lutimaris]
MTDQINPLATHHLPPFITAPGQTDGLLVGIGLFLIVVVFLLGIAFLWLHSLPERVAHKGQKLQFEVVAILCLLALFTHNNVLWGAALILAFIDLPDLATPLRRISDTLERLVGGGRQPVSAAGPLDPAVEAPQDSQTPAPTAGDTTTAKGH